MIWKILENVRWEYIGNTIVIAQWFSSSAYKVVTGKLATGYILKTKLELSLTYK